jgi:FMN phosphatase YigB (HAD superfamily)
MRIFSSGTALPRGAIIDLDGTLYPREAYIEPVLALIERMFVELRELPADLAHERVNELRSAMRDDWSGTSSTEWVLANGFTIAEWAHFRDGRTNVHRRLKPSPTVGRDLAHLGEHIKIALLTNNTRDSAEKILKALRVPRRLFDVIVYAEDAGLTPKPSTAAFDGTLLQLAVPAKNCWAIGDRHSIDIAPLEQLGGSGIEVSGPEELGEAVNYIIELSRRCS